MNGPNGYSAYGDESVTDITVVYAMVMLPKRAIADAERVIAAAKARRGVKPDSELHAVQLFHPGGRKKTAFAHLSLPGIVELYGEILTYLSWLRAGYAVCTIDRRQSPSTMTFPLPLDGREGPVGMKVNEKTLLVYACSALTRMIRDRFAGEEVSFVLDRESTMTDWYGKKSRLDSLHTRDDAFEGQLWPKGATIGGPNTPMLEIADLLAYVTGRCRAEPPPAADSEFAYLYSLMNPSSLVVEFAEHVLNDSAPL